MSEEIYRYGSLPARLSTQGANIDLLIHLLHIFMVVLFVGWGIFMIYCLVKFRARPGHKAQYHPIKAKMTKGLEIGVVVFEAFLLIGISMPAWSVLKDKNPSEEEALVVRVVAQQFAWNIHYPGPDGVFGRTKAELVDESLNPIGLDESDPAAEDDFYTINQLVVPEGKRVIVRLSSKDVIHSFFIPVFRIKQDAIPGMEVPVWFEAAKAFGEETKFEIACAQLCGLGHYRMRGEVAVLTQADFEAWLEEQNAPEPTFDDFGDFGDF